MSDLHVLHGSIANVPRRLTISFIVACIGLSPFSLSIVDAFCAPTADQATAEGGINAKDSELRSIEGELLKQLGMESQAPAPSEPHTISLPDVKALVAKPTPAPTTTPAAAAVKSLVSTEAPASELGTEEPTARAPQRSVVVATVKRPPLHKSSSARPGNDVNERLAISESQVTILSQQLEETKEALSRSEARVAELSRLVEQQTDAAVESPSALRTKLSPSLEDDAKALAVSFTTSSLPTARVSSSSAALRTTPGKGGATIYALHQNAAVRIELRNGSWYRVISSSGTRGWVSGQHLIFYEGSSPHSTVSVRAFDTNEEGMGIGY